MRLLPPFLALLALLLPRSAADGGEYGEVVDEDGSENEQNDAPPLAFGYGGNCNRETSRYVVDVLEDEVYPVLEMYDFSLPAACPLRAGNNAFAGNEAHKTYSRAKGWTCGYCSKVFRTEEFVDLHMDTRHSDKVPMTSTTACLADYCLFFNCLESRKARRDAKQERRKNKELRLLNERGENCNEEEMARERHRCELTFQKCFRPTESDTAHTLNEVFSHQFCDRLSCDADRRAASVLPETRMPSLRKLYYIMLGIFLVFLVLFYVVMWFYRREKALASDLRRLGASRRASRFSFWRSKSKLKAY